MKAAAALLLLAAAGTQAGRFLPALRHAGCAEKLLAMSPPSLRAIGLQSEDIARLHSAANNIPSGWQAWLDEPGHQLIAAGSEQYPARLLEIDDAPLALWADGVNPSLLRSPQLAIVGSRHPTSNGRLTAESLAASLSNNGITITSGLARGIDAASHVGALSGAGKTVAVLGQGIDGIYPAMNRALADRIRSEGIIVSEYPPQTPVRRGQFPRRNRIIAALTLGTLVVEANRRSGSLITARLANDYGREVFAVPGSIHNPLSKGCHKLLRDGAKLVEDANDLLIEIAPQLRAIVTEDSGAKVVGGIDDFPEILHGRLDFSPVSLDKLLAATGLTAAELSSMLLTLEIQGKIEALPGGRYCRLAKRA
jgi:DNA processing protein